MQGIEHIKQPLIGCRSQLFPYVPGKKEEGISSLLKNLLCVINGSGFSDDIDLNLSRILELVFNLL